MCHCRCPICVHISWQTSSLVHLVCGFSTLMSVQWKYSGSTVEVKKTKWFVGCWITSLLRSASSEQGLFLGWNIVPRASFSSVEMVQRFSSPGVPGVFLMSSILFGPWHTKQVQQSQYTVNDWTLWLSHAHVVKQRIMKPHHNVADCVFVCSQSYWDHLFNGRLEERMSGHKAADHRGHLQDLLVVIPIINMSHLVLSCSNYHWHRLRSYDWAVQTAHC